MVRIYILKYSIFIFSLIKKIVFNLYIPLWCQLLTDVGTLYKLTFIRMKKSFVSIKLSTDPTVNTRIIKHCKIFDPWSILKSNTAKKEFYAMQSFGNQCGVYVKQCKKWYFLKRGYLWNTKKYCKILSYIPCKSLEVTGLWQGIHVYMEGKEWKRMSRGNNNFRLLPAAQRLSLRVP